MTYQVGDVVEWEALDLKHRGVVKSISDNTTHVTDVVIQDRDRRWLSGGYSDLRMYDFQARVIGHRA